MAGIKIAAVAARFGRDVEANLGHIGRLVARARDEGARLVVLPECALSGYLEPGPPPGLAPSGPEIDRLAAIAGRPWCAPAMRRAARVGPSAPRCA